MESMYQLFKVGDIIDGFCNGYFGRDDYDRKICVMVSNQYAVFEWLVGDLKGEATVLNNPERLDRETVDSWRVGE